MGVVNVIDVQTVHTHFDCYHEKGKSVCNTNRYRTVCAVQNNKAVASLMCQQDGRIDVAC